MQSTFSKIAKIRKQKLNKIENEIMRLQYDIVRLQNDIEDVYIGIKGLVVPKLGDAELLSSYQEKRRLLNVEKRDLENRLGMKKKALGDKQEEHKKAQMDFEKIKYLEDQELMKKIIKINKDEQKDLDEMSNILQHKRLKS